MDQKIILIEDDDLVRQLYQEELTRAGLPTDGFGKGQEGLAALKSKKYDLLLLDIMLPDTNGLEILKQVKQDPATKNIKVVLLTNLGQEDVIKQGFELGADAYLIKLSYTPDQIVQEVKKTLAGGDK